MKFKRLDPVELIKKEKEDKKKPEKGVKAFFVSKFDPRMPHPRKLISRNYHHIALWRRTWTLVAPLHINFFFLQAILPEAVSLFRTH